jgi:hypothetical protein
VSVNLLYVAYNRLQFTQASFSALVEHTSWDEVATLHIHDDASSDGTADWLYDASRNLPVEVKYESRRLGGPVAAMNRHLDLLPATQEVGAFVKVDNDFIACPGWLPELLRVATLNPGLDVFGLQPRLGPPKPPPWKDRGVEPARYIGGIGLIRHRAFEVCRPVANGLFGWTEFQFRHPSIGKAWVVPDLPCFSLDLIDLEPWASFTAEYVAKGWAREWPKYEESGGADYYRWWTEAQVAA